MHDQICGIPAKRCSVALKCDANANSVLPHRGEQGEFLHITNFFRSNPPANYAPPLSPANTVIATRHLHVGAFCGVRGMRDAGALSPKRRTAPSCRNLPPHDQGQSGRGASYYGSPPFPAIL
ncbi:unnamed protein product [Lampetra planeri]